jgi:hypothetical protein
MNPSVSGANIEQATRLLLVQWEACREQWRDRKAYEFHERYLNMLPTIVSNTRPAIEDISNLLRKIKSDCE